MTYDEPPLWKHDTLKENNKGNTFPVWLRASFYESHWIFGELFARFECVRDLVHFTGQILSNIKHKRLARHSIWLVRTTIGNEGENQCFSYWEILSLDFKRCRVTEKNERSPVLHYGTENYPLTCKAQGTKTQSRTQSPQAFWSAGRLLAPPRWPKSLRTLRTRLTKTRKLYELVPIRTVKQWKTHWNLTETLGLATQAKENWTQLSRGNRT